MPWYIFAAATPLLYSFTNFIDKYLVDKKIRNPMSMTAIAGISSGFLGLIVGLVSGFKFLGIVPTSIIIFAGILLIFYLFPYYKAIKTEDPSRIVPLFGFIPIFTLILSSVFLKESLSARQIMGLMVVIAGSLFISAEKIEGRLFSPRKALWLMLLASFMYGSIGILFRFVVKGADFWTVFSYEYIGTGIGGLLLLISPKIRHGLRDDLSSIKSSTGIIVVNNVLAVSAQMSESYAVSLVAVPLVNIVGGIQPLIVLVEGILLTAFFPKFVKEDIKKGTIYQKLIAIALMFGGLYLVYF